MIVDLWEENVRRLVGTSHGRAANRRSFRVWRLAPILALLAACGPDSGGHNAPAPPPPQAFAATSSSLVGVNPGKGRVYIALPTLNSSTGNGQVEVINVNADPDKTDPRVAIIDLGHPDYPGGIAIDAKSGTVIVASGGNGHGGFLDLIKESDNSIVTGSPFAFPTGADSGIKGGNAGQVLFDPLADTAVVSTVDAASGCSSPGACTGFADFDLNARTFGSIIRTPEPDQFAFNATLEQIIGPSDTIDPTIIAVDVKNSDGCELSDQNMSSLNADPDGVGIDPTTNIVVIGNYNSTQATVINLQGSSFDEAVSPCVLNEGGTPPNSTNIDTLTGADMPGVAVNPITHQALMTGNDDASIALLGLPAAAAAQLDTTVVTALAHSSIPNDPSGAGFNAAAFPYGTVIDVKHNFGYVVDSGYNYLARIDLKLFKSNPSGISTALPSGNCAGTSTTLACDNGAGVVFFPL